MNGVHACLQAQRDVQRVLAHCPWIPWAVPVAFAAVAFPLRLAVEHLAQSTHLLLPACHPIVLVLFCLTAGALAVPLYRAARVIRPLLLVIPGFYLVFAHYLIGYAFHLGGTGSACSSGRRTSPRSRPPCGLSWMRSASMERRPAVASGTPPGGSPRRSSCPRC